MVEEHPSNAVLAEKIDAMAKANSVFQVGNHEAQNLIIAQVTKTNGRVTSLEKSKNMFTGALVLANLIAVPIILAYMMHTFIQ